MSTVFYDCFDSPIGTLTIAADQAGLRQVLFAQHRYPARGQADWQHAPDAPVLIEPRRQLLQYLHGQRRHFELLLREGNREALLDRLDQWRTAQQDARPIAARLARISAPTLLLWGAQDRLLPLADARGFIGRLPQARLQVFDKLGHVPQEEDAAATLALVKPFFGLR